MKAVDMPCNYLNTNDPIKLLFKKMKLFEQNFYGDTLDNAVTLDESIQEFYIFNVVFDATFSTNESYNSFVLLMLNDDNYKRICACFGKSTRLLNSTDNRDEIKIYSYLYLLSKHYE